jgi:hypothetical protein
MTLLQYRSVQVPCALNPLSARYRARLEMRWCPDANGRLTCTWQLVPETAPARSDDEEAKLPQWLWVFLRTDNHQTDAKPQ